MNIHRKRKSGKKHLLWAVIWFNFKIITFNIQNIYKMYNHNATISTTLAWHSKILNDPKTAPYCSFINIKAKQAKRLSKIHQKRNLNIKSLSTDNISYQL